MDVAVKLEIFEGPLDLLLHLIRKNEVDIYDIPIALITKQYLDYLEMMRELNISLAGEFLVMASTLTHIKSRMLLPSYSKADDDDEDGDPLDNLVERLRDHMRIKAAADMLMERQWLDRDVFMRQAAVQEIDHAVQSQPQQLVAAGVFELIEAFRELLADRSRQLVLDLPLARMSVEDRMGVLLDQLRRHESLSFIECFAGDLDRSHMVVTFLSILELTRLGLIRVYQERLDEEHRPSVQWSVLRVFLRENEDELEDEL